MASSPVSPPFPEVKTNEPASLELYGHSIYVHSPSDPPLEQIKVSSHSLNGYSHLPPTFHDPPELPKTYLSQVQALQLELQAVKDECEALRQELNGREEWHPITQHVDSDQYKGEPDDLSDVVDLYSYSKVLMDAVWMIVLMMMLSFSSYILSQFNTLLSDKLVLIEFIVVLVGTTGNSGSQFQILISRAFQLQGDQFKSILKFQLTMKVFTTLILGVVLYGRIMIQYPQEQLAAGVITVSLYLSIFTSVLFGLLFTLFFKKISCCRHSDADIPLLTTLMDVIVIPILCGVATLAWYEFPLNTE